MIEMHVVFSSFFFFCCYHSMVYSSERREQKTNESRAREDASSSCCFFFAAVAVAADDDDAFLVFLPEDDLKRRCFSSLFFSLSSVGVEQHESLCLCLSSTSQGEIRRNKEVKKNTLQQQRSEGEREKKEIESERK